MKRLMIAVAALALTGGGCATAIGSGDSGRSTSPEPQPGARASGDLLPGLRGLSDPFPSTYRPLPTEDLAIVGATVLTGSGQRIENGVVVLSGRISAVGGPDTPIPAGVRRIDAAGRFVTPGIIDAHSHLGVYPSPSVQATSDGNEATSPNTGQVWSEHSVWPQDPGFNRAREGGVTTLQILPGSANLFGGRSVTLRNVPSVSMQGMKFPEAPYGLKMACGENPSRVYGGRNQSPATGMGNMAGYRAAWIEAQNYRRRWEAYERTGEGDPPTRDLRLETLAGVLSGDILVQNHCYRADEMMLMIDLAREFGYRITTFHHASEGYKIADVLAAEGICSATWAGWWGFKMESLDGIEENAALLEAAGACAVIHSDDETLTQRLNQEAAAALSAGRRAGLDIAEETAIAWITLNAARAIGIEDQTGSLEVGKRADVVIWSANPFSIYARADQVFIDGARVHDRFDPTYQPRSDFELGQPGQEGL
ncbi:MAG TPA: amidohydrolase [Brevundimonas sp.]|uniref:amidohydrolase n=1 Tax=Brevundimonas sp. TaxID=1871086 RepID=UPI002BEE42E8|nr:amidohydrolase [Brevundimonas sp.]HRH20359.1 amidohydrolase [Brevundimonas sp.]